MKTTVNGLKSGQKVWATIEEVTGPKDLIVSFNGDLLRVSNHSDRVFRTGQRVQLNVESIKPLQFRLVETKRIKFGIDIEA